jgi:hypothetical protein
VVIAATEIAFAVAVSFVANQLLANQSPLPKPSDAQAEIRQPLAPRMRSYGTVRIAGVLFWFSASGRVLYKGLAINHGRIAEFVSFHIDENQVDLDTSDQVISNPYTSQNVFIYHHLGLTPESEYDALQAVSGLSGLRGDGVASMVGEFENPTNVNTFQNTYPGGQPELRATINASVVFDPRDADQDRDDESTWGFSDNVVLCLMDYLAHADGYGIPWEKIEANLDQWIAAADVCDELVDLAAGGTTRKYRVAGTYRLTDAPRDVVRKFESACDGRVWVKRDGSIGISVGKFPDNVNDLVHITDAQVLGYDKLTRGQDALTSIQGIRAEYLSPQHDYREYEAEPWPTADEVLALSEDRVMALDLLWVPGNSQARRLMKRAYMRATGTWHGTVHINAAVLRLIDERYCRLTITELGILDQTFEIMRFAFDPGGPRGEIDIVSVDASIDDWDVSEEGSIEADTLELVDHFEKTGTTIDVLGEASAEIGEYVVVAAHNNTSIPALPAGWSIIGTTMVDSSINARVIGRLIDGTETTITVNGANGSILVQRFRGLGPSPQVANFTEHTEASNAFSTFTPKSPAPFLSYAFAVANDVDSSVSWLALVDDEGDPIEDFSFRTSFPAPSGNAHVELVIFQEGEEAPDNIISHMNADTGSAQGIIAFNLLPA